MSDSWDEIEASLRRQFEPPTLDGLDGLNERIALAAAQREADEPAHGSTAGATAGRDRRARRLSVAVVFAVAAAAVLLVVLPRFSAPVDSVSLRSPEVESDSTTVATAMAARMHAGRQLDEFLRAEATLPTMEQSCMAAEPGSDSAGDPGPWLPPTPGIQVRGECGGATGIIDCAAHALPVQRALLVRLEHAKVDVIVCIERPAADPRPVLPPASGYSMFRHTLGEYVLYEITPLAEPMVLDHLTVI